MEGRAGQVIADPDARIGLDPGDIGLGKVRSEPQGFAILLNGVGEVTRLLPGFRQPVMRLGFIWREPGLLRKLRGGFGGLMIIEQGQSKIETELGLCRLQPDRCGKMGKASVTRPCLARAMASLLCASTASGLSRMTSEN